MRGFVYEMKHATELALIWFVTFALAPISARVRLATVSLTLICYLSLYRHTNTRSFMQPIKRFMVGAFVPFTVAGVQIFGGGVYAVMTRVSLNMG